jgi:hypothetical protein
MTLKQRRAYGSTWNMNDVGGSDNDDDGDNNNNNDYSLIKQYK